MNPQKQAHKLFRFFDMLLINKRQRSVFHAGNSEWC